MFLSSSESIGHSWYSNISREISFPEEASVEGGSEEDGKKKKKKKTAG